MNSTIDGRRKEENVTCEINQLRWAQDMLRCIRHIVKSRRDQADKITMRSYHHVMFWQRFKRTLPQFDSAPDLGRFDLGPQAKQPADPVQAEQEVNNFAEEEDDDLLDDMDM